MTSEKWLEQLAAQLKSRRIPASYRGCLLGELREHCADLTEEGMKMEEVETRIGAPHDVADIALAEYQQLRFCRRHPVLIFVVAPIVVTPLLLAAYLFALCGVGTLVWYFAAGDDCLRAWETNSVIRWMVRTSIQGMKFIPFAMGAILFVHLARRVAVRSTWTWTAVALIALLAGMFHIGLRLNPSPGSSEFSIGLMVGMHLHWSQLFVPLVIAGISMAWHRPTQAAHV